MTTTGAGTGTPRVLDAPEPRGPEPTAHEHGSAGAWRWSRWVAIPFAIVYLVLLARHLGAIVRATNLDADAASGPVIAELFGVAPAHAHVVLGEFAWYATLLFDLATKWLPHHRQVWEYAPYAMALAGGGLAAWSVWLVAGRWAAGLTGVLLICASPATLQLELSTTQHASVWFCLALLGAYLVLLERRNLGWPLLIPLVLVIGTIVGVNAASDPLTSIAAVGPFALGLVATRMLVAGRQSARALWSGLATLAVTGVAWAVTAAVMSGLAVTREPGLHSTRIVIGHKTGENFTLWWKSIAVLSNGDFFGRPLSPGSALAFACAVLGIAAVASLPGLSWWQLRGRSRAGRAPGTAGAVDSARYAFFVFWCSSAILLTLAFLFSAAPADIGADRYLVGLLSAAAAVVPAAVAARPRAAAVVLAGTCTFALGGVVSMAQGGTRRASHGTPSVTSQVADEIARIAAREHMAVGYAGYWDAAPITWASGFRVQVYPVAVCDQDKRLCRFDLHFISSWYWPRPRARSFLLTDSSPQNVWMRPNDLGRPYAVYRLGPITMYAYRYDLAGRIVS